MPLASKPDPDADPADAERRCRRQAMDLLARREHSRLELERKLATGGFEPLLIAAVLDDLQRDRLLEESRYLESFIRAHARKGKGPARIRLELKERGVADGPIRDALALAGFDWVALAAEARAKRFGMVRPKDFKERARQARFLQYRGFTTDQINAALDLAAD